jgi:hypothetical protein
LILLGSSINEKIFKAAFLPFPISGPNAVAYPTENDANIIANVALKRSSPLVSYL